MIAENISKVERFKQLKKVAVSQLNTLDNKDFMKSLKRLNERTYIEEKTNQK